MILKQFALISFCLRFEEENVQKNCIYDLIWLNRNDIACGGGDKNISIVDTETFEQKLLLKGHSESVKSLATLRQNTNLLASASRDSSILVYDLRFNKNTDGTLHAINTIQSAHMCSQPSQQAKTPSKTPSKTLKFASAKAKSPVACIVYHNEHMLISCGAIDNQIKIWDLRKTYSNRFIEPQPLHILNNEFTTKGYSNLVLSYSNRYLYANNMNNHIYEFDLWENFNENFKCMPIVSTHSSIHKNGSNYVKSSISPCDSFLLTGSSDNSAIIYPLKYKNHAKALKFDVHTSEVTAVDWSANDLNQLITCSDDNTIRLWNVKKDLHESITDKCDMYRVKVYETPVDDSVPMATSADESQQISTFTNENYDLFRQKHYSTKFHATVLYNDLLFTNYQLKAIENEKKAYKNQQQISILNTPKFQLKPRKVFALTKTMVSTDSPSKTAQPTVTTSTSKKRTIDKIFSEVLNLNSPNPSSSMADQGAHVQPASKRRLILESTGRTPVKNNANENNSCSSNPNTPTKALKTTTILDFFSPKSQKHS
jgi:WD40 repeat protein